jgi:arsenate reductase
MATWNISAVELDAITRGHVDRGIEGLVDEFRGVFSRETITRYVEESLSSLPAARFADFIPVLVHRFARERLHALGQSQGAIAKDVPEVLFVCVHNSGRSQMAAGLLHQRAAGLVHVRSAGSDPAERINPNVVEAMREIGVDLSQEFPKPLTDEVVRAADAVITMGCGDACPIFPGKRYEDWEVEDPAGQDLEAARRVRDEIDGRVQLLLATVLEDRERAQAPV